MRLRGRDEREQACGLFLPQAYHRPDPLLYSQAYLKSMGLAVTWDNPDVELFEPGAGGPHALGAPVPSSRLEPGRVYRVRVRVWNGSYDAPAVGLPVHLSYLSFGAGTQTHPIATTFVDLGVKGSPDHPAFAFLDWRTPDAPGHYCLQARLEWSDDANPNNNLGQENVDVGVTASPAEFRFDLRNQAAVRRRFALEADTYRLPDPGSCEESPYAPRRGERPRTRLAESRARWEVARREHAADAFPVPATWTVGIEPAEVVLEAGEQREIVVRVDLPQPTRDAPEPLNVNAYALREGDERDFVGGVTVYVEKP